MRIVIAEHDRLTALKLRERLEADGDFEVAGVARRGSQIETLVAGARPDVILLDMRIPDDGGFACLHVLRRHHPAVAVVAFSPAADPLEVEEAFRKGVRAYVLDRIAPSDLGPAIRQGVHCTAYHPVRPPHDESIKARGLTRREQQVLHGLARGLTNRQIASELSIADQTVRSHLGSIFRKLGVGNRTRAALWMLTHVR